MFNLPKGAQNFNYDELNIDDPELERELEQILNASQSVRSKNIPHTSETTNRTSSNQNVSSQTITQSKQAPDFDLSILSKLNLNDHDDQDDEDFDENDPDLEAQLAAIVGNSNESSLFSSEKLPPVRSEQRSEQVPSVSSKPVRPPPTYQQSLNQASTNPLDAPNINASSSCLILDNSHFFNNDSKSSGEEQKLDKQNEHNSILQKQSINAQHENSSSSQHSGENKKTNENSEQEPITLLQALNLNKQRLDASLIKEQAANNSSKVRMMTRLIKQYETAIKANKAGKSYDYSSLPQLPGFDPLPIDDSRKPSTNTVHQVNQPTFSPQGHNLPKTDESFKSQPIASPLAQLEKLKNDFKSLALEAKKMNDIDKARTYLQKMKEVSAAIEKLNNGESVDLSLFSKPSSGVRNQEENLQSQANKSKVDASSSEETLIGALERIKSKFEKTLEKEQMANNSVKVRMMTRIVKQYEQAIKACKSNKSFDYESLPASAELPLHSHQTANSTSSTLPVSDQEQLKQSTKPTIPNEPKSSTTTTKPKFERSISINNKQLEYLLKRQALFKEAAMKASKSGDTSQAVDYLRKSKGFTPLIDAVRNGLPIDVSNIPIPPQLENDDFVIVSHSNESANLDLDTEEHYRKLELELSAQISLCEKNKDHFFKIGDVSSGSKFEKYLIDMKKDCEMLKSYKQRGENVPKYHYELKQISIVVCNTDVSINEVLIEIIRAIDLPCKQPVDSYVKFEFPFPKDATQPARTHSAKNSLYPEYNQSFKFSIDRKARSLARIFSKTLKMEIFSKGGLFRSDELIGNVIVDISSLRTKCTLYDSFPILSGRREIGGKLQVRIKLREPLLSKQVEVIKEKWLAFDYNQ